MAVSPSKTVRQLALGSGTISDQGAVGQTKVVFSNDQSFKEGATLYTPGYSQYSHYTIDSGSGKVWSLKQPIHSPGLGTTFYTSDPSSSRARGGSGNTAGVIVPNARHFIYVSMLDASGNPDMYVYLDTLFPEKGLHPYTKDRSYGSAVSTYQWLCPVDGTHSAGRICPVDGSLCNYDDGGAGIFAIDLGLRLQAMDAGRPVV